MKFSATITLFCLLCFWKVSFGQEYKPSVVTSASMISDMAKNIGMDKVEILTIVPIGGDPHLHEPTPRDAQIVASADLILINGLTFEGWITELIDNSGTKAKSLVVTEGVDILTSQTYYNSADPHAWMDVSNAIIYVENITEALCELIPENAKFFKSNQQNYTQKLLALDTYILQAIKTIPEEKRVLITSHDAFQYFGRRYGIRLEAIMGISTEAEAQTSDIIRVTDAIKESGVPAIFIESTINPKLIQQIAKDNKIVIGGRLYADSLGDQESHASTYLDMLRYNTDIIVSALRGEGAIQSSEKGLNSLSLFLIGLILLVAIILVYSKLQ